MSLYDIMIERAKFYNTLQAKHTSFYAPGASSSGTNWLLIAAVGVAAALVLTRRKS